MWYGLMKTWGFKGPVSALIHIDTLLNMVYLLIAPEGWIAFVIREQSRNWRDG